MSKDYNKINPQKENKSTAPLDHRSIPRMSVEESLKSSIMSTNPGINSESLAILTEKIIPLSDQKDREVLKIKKILGSSIASHIINAAKGIEIDKEVEENVKNIANKLPEDQKLKLKEAVNSYISVSQELSSIKNSQDDKAKNLKNERHAISRF